MIKIQPPFTPRVVFSSATFLDIPTFLKRLGLDPKDAAVVEVPSTFEADKAPITFPLNRYLSKAFLKPEMKESLDEVAKEVERIADAHSDAKGVIHFPSYEWFRKDLCTSP
jgi:Rad3-related DNA helicase